jgi:hypothetical protein
MHIDHTTHEHGSSGKVYSYEADYDISDALITWNSNISQAGALRCNISGAVPLTSPALASLAEKVVRDAIVKRIDSFEDSHGGALGALGAG